MKHAVAILDAYLESLERLGPDEELDERDVVHASRSDNPELYDPTDEQGIQDVYRDWMEVYQESFLDPNIWEAGPFGDSY